MGAWEGDVMDNAGNDSELLKRITKRPFGTTPPWTLKSLTQKATPSETQIFKRSYKISHNPGL